MRISELKDKHKGETAWIVGLGPSIKDLQKNDFGDGPVITLNQSIVAVQRLSLKNDIYSMQKDDDPPAYIIPNTGIPLILHELESLKTFPKSDIAHDREPCYIFNNPDDFGLLWNTISIISATEIGRLMGCYRIKYVCCDAHAKGILGTYIPHEDGTSYLDNAELRNSYLMGQMQSLKPYLAQFPIEYSFITPGEEEIQGGYIAPPARVFFMNGSHLQELR